jgi:type VI secretion system protein ImpJ
MHLAPHHFQAQGAFFEDALHFALSGLSHAPYGVAGCALDHDALRNGTVAVVHARGVMPDGLAFHIPDGDPPPPPREIHHLLSPARDGHLVSLAIPAYRHGGANVAPPAGGRAGARYTAESRVVRDETTGRDDRAVSVGRKNFRLSIDGDESDDEVTLPLARVRRDAAGHLVYDPHYVPPCLQIGASEPLLDRLLALVDHLDDACARISSQRRAPESARDGAADLDVAALWVVHAIRSCAAPLGHHLRARRARPEQLYTELARLAGALCTLARDSHPRMLPPYDHEQLGDCFGALDRHIRAHLELLQPLKRVLVPLRRTAAYLYTAAVPDWRCFGRSHWVLGVRTTDVALGAAAVIAQVPEHVKVCSSRFAVELVKRARRGLTLEHLPVPPAAASPRADWQYFTIGKVGPCWEDITKTGEVGLYLPDTLADAELSLVVLLED